MSDCRHEHVDWVRLPPTVPQEVARFAWGCLDCWRIFGTGKDSIRGKQLVPWPWWEDDE